jgi:hypothetical protein
MFRPAIRAAPITEASSPSRVEGRDRLIEMEHLVYVTLALPSNRSLSARHHFVVTAQCPSERGVELFAFADARGTATLLLVLKRVGVKGRVWLRGRCARK